MEGEKREERDDTGTAGAIPMDVDKMFSIISRIPPNIPQEVLLEWIKLEQKKVEARMAETEVKKEQIKADAELKKIEADKEVKKIEADKEVKKIEADKEVKKIEADKEVKMQQIKADTEIKLAEINADATKLGTKDSLRMTGSHFFQLHTPADSDLSDIVRDLDGYDPSIVLPKKYFKLIGNITLSWPEADFVFDSFEELHAVLKPTLSQEELSELSMIKEDDSGKVVAVGTQQLMNMLLKDIASRSKKIRTQFVDRHNMAVLESFRPDFIAQARYASGTSGIVSIGDVKRVEKRAFPNAEVGKLLRDMMAVMVQQPTRPSMIAWMCNMREIQFFKICRSGTKFEYLSSPVVSLQHPTREDHVGPGLEALIRMMASSPESHGYSEPPPKAKAILAYGATASVFEGEDKKSAFKVFTNGFSYLIPAEAEIIRSLPNLLKNHMENGGIMFSKVGDVSKRLSKDVHPPLLALKDVQRLDGTSLLNGTSLHSKADARILVTEPLCERISRRSFSACRTKAQVVMDFLNTLIILHSGKMCHGDIRPANLMMHNGRGVVIDYGLAHVAAQEKFFKEDLVRLVLVIMYWTTNNRLFFYLEEMQADVLDESKLGHVPFTWYAAVHCALERDVVSLAQNLVKLVTSEESIMLNEDSPPEKLAIQAIQHEAAAKRKDRDEAETGEVEDAGGASPIQRKTSKTGK